MVDVWCGGCPILLIVWWMSGVVDVWCGGRPFFPMVWWMSGVVDVCVVDIVQSEIAIKKSLNPNMSDNKAKRIFCQHTYPDDFGYVLWPCNLSKIADSFTAKINKQCSFFYSVDKV